MDIEAFWRLMEESLSCSPGRRDREAFLRERLAALRPDDIVQFQVHVDQACERADTWDLWGAAMRIFGGWCSDDGFDYFRLWLVGRGRDAFERAVAQPDALAELPEIQRLAGRHRRTWDGDTEWPEWESLDHVAAEAYRRTATATEDEHEDEDECDEGFYEAVEAQLNAGDFSRGPAGTRWEARDEDAAAQKVPALAAMFRLGGTR